MTLKRQHALILAVVILAGMGLAAAQTTSPTLNPEVTPEATAEPIDCTDEGIIAQQAELDSLLDDLDVQIVEDRDAALGHIYEVGRTYQEIALECGYLPDDLSELFVGTNIERILTALETLDGDPVNGQLLYNGEAPGADGRVLGCSGCHDNGEIAPLTEGTWTRWDEIRRHDPVLADYTFERYIVESIVLPWDYSVPEYPDFRIGMPNNFGDRLSFQDLADLIIYLESQDQLLDD